MSNDSASHPAAIAVVGVSALFPGSQDATGFWNDILRGRDLLSDVPASHWRIDDYYDPDPSAPDKTYARRGGFLSPIDFDALGFGIPPAMLPATDTSQLLALIVAQAVLEDAAREKFASMDRSRISVILGVTSAQELLFSMVSRLQRPVWVKALRESGLPEPEVQQACDRIAAHYVPWQEASFPGLLGNVVAGRIANRLNLGGTNCVTDAACASTFSALSMAINELQLGHSDMAIAGGVDTLNDIFMYMCFSKTPALSPSGDCRPFSDQADGTMLGEGLGMVALKRLADAERDGDRIYAVLRGVGTGSDGRSKSVYAPVAAGQAKALRRAYGAAGYSAATVELMEAHGTGTKAGDVAEFEGLRMVYDEADGARRQWCALGSVKSQIGHTKAAAGAAGLFKAVMALHHKVLPPTIKIDAPNPKLEIERSPFYLNTEARPWIRGSDHPRRAAVSAFGFGGSNFHVTLEEYLGPGAHAERLPMQPCDLILAGADSAPALLQRLDALFSADAPLARIAHDSRVAFDTLVAPAHRAAVVASTRDELQQRLAAVRARIAAQPALGFELPDGSSYGVGTRAGDVAFLFPGQGSQYLGMGAALAMQFDAARSVWDQVADLQMDGDTRLHQVMFPRPAFDAATRKAQQEALTCTEWAQPAIGAHSAALLAQLRALGIAADAYAGHSFGEVSALHAAGACDVATAIRIARRRGELMRDAAAATAGAMTALSLPADEVQALLAQHAPTLVLANHNAPNQVVVSGALDAIAAFEATLQAQGIACKRLPVATAFHSPLVASCSDAFARELAALPIAATTSPVFGNASGACFPQQTEAMCAQLAAQIANPVRFVAMVEAMYAQGLRIFVEVGPNQVLSGLVGAILGARPHQVIALDRKGRDGVESLLIGLARLAAAGVAMQSARLFADTRLPALAKSAPKLGVAISGSNYGKPYPPAYPADLPPPNPPRALPQPAPAVATTPRTASPTPVAASHVLATEAGTEAMSAPEPLNAAWLAAFQESQQQTAAAHEAFQRTMAESHAAYLKLAEAALLGLAGVNPEAASVGAVVGAAEAAMPLSTSQPEASRLPPLPPPPHPQVALAESNRAVTGAPTESLAPLLLAIVAEKTGYPVDMLNLDMDLEGDLGVDSIKRVEILAAVDERTPNLPKVDRARLSALHTLREIVDYLAGASGDVGAPAGAMPLSTSAPEASRLPPLPQVQSDLPVLLLTIVAEKTGYPVDMLNLDMDLEGDLGVDSIKRVEILAAVDERAPNLPKVDRARLSALHTLREIVDYHGAVAGEVGAPAGAMPLSTSAPEASRLPPLPQAQSDLPVLLLTIVAEKTGYPVDMLNLDMDLEGDLGVDSIKRVEILAAVDERAPNLPKVDRARLSALHTLREIVDYLAGASGNVGAPAGAMPLSTSAPEASRLPPLPQAQSDLPVLLLTIVAEKTGYPVDMLNLDMDLEGDLGVDSIKRVEILAAVDERAPNLPKVDRARLSALHTLREIVDYLGAGAGDVGAPAGAMPLSTSASEASRLPPLPQVAPTEDGLGRYALELIPAPATGFAMPGLLSGVRVHVTGDDQLAPLVADALHVRGVAAVAVSSLPDTAIACVHLGGLLKIVDVDAAIALNRELFQVARSLAPRLQAGPGLFVSVQDTGGRFGLDTTPAPREWLAGLPALIKTCALEWPKASVKAIDLQTQGRSPIELAAAIADELLAGGGEIEVALPVAGGRQTLRSVARAVDASAPVLANGDVVVVSGGARGVTAACLLAWAKRVRARFVLLGRTALQEEPAACAGIIDEAGLKRALFAAALAAGEQLAPSTLLARVQQVLAQREIRQTLAALHAAGCEARYCAVAVNDPVAVAATLAEVRAGWGPIRALVHAAGVLADKRIADKTDAQFAQVFDTKVQGLRALLAATADDPLKLLCVFSSVSARCGNTGQADYAMANEVLAKVAAAEARRRAGLRVKSLGWGPWEGGMVSPQLKQRFAALGVPMIPLGVGARMFADEMADAGADGVELVLGGEPRAEALLFDGADVRVDALEVSVQRGSHAWLEGHAVDGAPVVPMVLVAEWLARAARSFRPGLALVALQELKVLKGIRLDGFENGGDRFRIEAQSLPGTAPTALQMTVRDSAGRPRYSARAELQPLPATANADVPRLVLDDWQGAGPYPELLFHRGQFELIEQMQGISDEGVAARVRGVQAAKWPQQDWQLDVAALDGGMQLAVLYGRRMLGGPNLPTAIDSVRRYATEASAGPITVSAHRREVGRSAVTTDIYFVDAQGQRLAELIGVHNHVLMRA